MKVEGPATSRAAQVRRRSAAGAAGDSSFAAALEGDAALEAEARPAVGGVAPTTAVDALLALQGAGADEDSDKKRAQMRAEELLRQLDQLRFDLLSGAIPRARLAQLGHMLRAARGQVFDPRLTELLDDIELRAAVELAKYESQA